MAKCSVAPCSLYVYGRGGGGQVMDNYATKICTAMAVERSCI